jgi:GntR family transcriptional regulator
LPALLTVDPRSGVPLYLQIIEQVKRAVAMGALAPGEQLPTVKALALNLTINPNTVARAYRDLEHDGVIETSPGRGSFVRSTGAPAAARDSVAGTAARALGDAVREAKAVGLSRDEMRAIFENTLTRWYEPEEQA